MSEIRTKGWKMGEYPMELPKPKTPDEALDELESFNHRLSAKILRKALAEANASAEANSDLLLTIQGLDEARERMHWTLEDIKTILADEGDSSPWGAVCRIRELLGIGVEEFDTDEPTV